MGSTQQFVFDLNEVYLADLATIESWFEVLNPQGNSADYCSIDTIKSQTTESCSTDSTAINSLSIEISAFYSQTQSVYLCAYNTDEVVFASTLV